MNTGTMPLHGNIEDIEYKLYNNFINTILTVKFNVFYFLARKMQRIFTS